MYFSSSTVYEFDLYIYFFFYFIFSQMLFDSNVNGVRI